MNIQKLAFNFLICFALFLGPASALALTHFPKKTCTLEGYLEKNLTNGTWTLSVNKGTNSETRFKISNPSLLKNDAKSGEYVSLKVKIPKETFSIDGEATFVQFIKLLNPYRKVKTYVSPADTANACR